MKYFFVKMSSNENDEKEEEVVSRISKVYKYNYRYSKEYGFYDPIMCGSIDGTDEKPHDSGIIRAMNTNYQPNKLVQGDAEKILFIGRLSYKTSEEKLRNIFSEFGRLKSVRLVRDVITGHSKGYGFVEFKHRSDAKKAQEESFKLTIDERDVIVEFEHERRLKGWVPRRLGGGFGGFKESGQLRFGSRYKPFGKILTPSHFHHKNDPSSSSSYRESSNKQRSKDKYSKRRDRSRSSSRSHKRHK